MLELYLIILMYFVLVQKKTTTKTMWTLSHRIELWVKMARTIFGHTVQGFHSTATTYVIVNQWESPKKSC